MTNLTNQRQVFVEEYVRSGDHLDAIKKAGHKDTHTLRNHAFKLRKECTDDISEELHRNFAEIAPRALNILSELAKYTERTAIAAVRPIEQMDIGHLGVSALGDVTILYEESGSFEFLDAISESIFSDKKLGCVGLVVDGVYCKSS